MPKHILYVEDSANTAMALKVMLELKGYRVMTRSTVRGACEALREQQFDVLISDIGLPDGDGWDILRDPHTPAKSIAISGYTAEKDKQKALEHGFTAFLSKPFATADLIEEIER